MIVWRPMTPWVSYPFVMGLLAVVGMGAWKKAPRWLAVPLALLALFAFAVILIGPLIALLLGYFPFGSLTCEFLGGPSCA